MSIHDCFHSYNKTADDESHPGTDGCYSINENNSKWTVPLISGDFSMKKQLDAIVQNFEKGKIQPDLIGEIILKNKINIMLLDMYGYDKGFSISFLKFGDEEVLHGEYSYEVSLFESIQAGEIPSEVFVDLYEYDFKIFYDGYIMCQLRIHFENEDNFRSHYIFLKHSIQTIDIECAMNSEADRSLDYATEKARLIAYYSPNLYLDFDPAVSEIISNECNRHLFITSYFRNVIHNKKAQSEKLAKELSASKKYKIDQDWNFRVNTPEPEEAELPSSPENEFSIESYLRGRKICFPAKEYFTGSYVEIENVVYEYLGFTKAGEVKSIRAKLSISVLNEKEYYYSYYQQNERVKKFVPITWSPIGRREELDMYIQAITHEKLKVSSTELQITHNRIFEENVKVVDGRVKITRFKLEVPASEILFQRTSHSP